MRRQLNFQTALRGDHRVTLVYIEATCNTCVDESHNIYKRNNEETSANPCFFKKMVDILLKKSS